ncbi:MAG TPA: biotin/lipoyl-binding protein [Firmicutes bacterium]|nr:biotin/lipoyl-binding protein [Bacillota bacterium]
MKTFKVTVDGQVYTVQVEEINEADSKNNSTGPAAAPAHKKPAGRAPENPAVNKPAAAETATRAPAEKPGAGVKVEAPMPGSILEIKVSAGDTVNEGDVLLIFEAMKMENELTAPQAGTVAEILVKKGDSVNSGDPLVVLNP